MSKDNKEMKASIVSQSNTNISLGMPIAHHDDHFGAVEDNPNQRETADHHMNYSRLD